MGIDAQTALELVLKATVILAGAAIGDRCLRRASAAWRNAVWSLALAMICVLPVCRLLISTPIWVPVGPPRAAMSPNIAPQRSPADSSPQARSNGSFETAPTGGTADPTPRQSAPPAQQPVSAMSRPPFVAARPGNGFTVQETLAVIWISGAVVVLLPWLLLPVMLTWRCRRARRVKDEHWKGLLKSLRKESHVLRPVRLLKSPDCSVPLTFRIFLPVIVLPAKAVDGNEWTESHKRMVLLHELAHIRRWDSVTFRVAWLACAIYWFHPLAWYGARRMRREAERACDDAVLGTGVKGSDYAQALMDVAATIGKTPRVPLGAMAMVQMSTLEGRVRAILDAAVNHRAIPRNAAGLTRIALLAAIPVAMLRAEGRAIILSPTTTARLRPMSGHVVDERGAPVAGVRVESRSEIKLLSTVSGPDGAFTLQCPENYIQLGCLAYTPDAARMGLLNVRVRPGFAPPTDLQVVLRPSRTLDVTVADAKGRPVREAIVGAFGGYSSLCDEKTDARGKALLHIPVDAATVTVFAEKPNVGLDYFDYSPNDIDGKSTLQQAGALEPLHLVLNGTSTLSVRVTDDAGAPLMGAQVFPLYAEGGRSGSFSAWNDHLVRTTDARGRATFDYFSIKDDFFRITFWVYADGYPAHRQWTYDADNGRKLGTVTLKKLVHVTGSVTRQDGSPAGDSLVFIAGEGYQGYPEHFSAQVTTDANGQLAADVNPDLYYVFVARLGQEVSPPVRNVILRESPAPITLNLQPGRRVFGRLTNGPENLPLANSPITLSWSDEPGYPFKFQLAQQTLPRSNETDFVSPVRINQFSETDKDGNYEFFTTPGLNLLSAFNGQKFLSANIVITREKEYRQDLPQKYDPYRIRAAATHFVPGTAVIADQPGAEVGEYTMTIMSKEDSADPAVNEFPSSGQKEFTLCVGSEDFYLAGITPDRALVGFQTVKASDASILLALRPAAQLHGRLVDAAGKPIARRELHFDDPLAAPESILKTSAFGGSVITADDGTFVFTGIVPGRRYAVTAYKPVDDAVSSHALGTVQAERAGMNEAGDLSDPG